MASMRRPRPKDFYLREEDGERHGFSRGCADCASWYRGLARPALSPGCRERFRELLQEQARVKLAGERRKEFDRRVERRGRKKVEEEEAERRKTVTKSAGGSGQTEEERETGRREADERGEEEQGEVKMECEGRDRESAEERLSGSGGYKKMGV